jgi:hypothetical protein
MDGLQK